MAEDHVSELMENLYANEQALDWLQGPDRGLELEMILEAQLGYVPPGRKHGNSISIPYHDVQGRWRTNRYRLLPPVPEDQPKYKAEHGGGRHLYNVAAVDEPVVYVTEGEFDSLILRQLGLASVAVPGANAWNRAWRWLFRNCDMVFVVFDTDTNPEQAGQKGGQKVAGAIGSVTAVEPIRMPPDKDVTALYLENPDELKKLMVWAS